jgi:hypothetical protein
MIEKKQFERIKEDMKLEDEMMEECTEYNTPLTARSPGRGDHFEARNMEKYRPSFAK